MLDYECATIKTDQKTREDKEGKTGRVRMEGWDGGRGGTGWDGTGREEVRRGEQFPPSLPEIGLESDTGLLCRVHGTAAEGG